MVKILYDLLVISDIPSTASTALPNFAEPLFLLF